MIGSHQMSTKARDAYDEARKKGDMEEMKKIAEEQHEIRQERKGEEGKLLSQMNSVKKEMEPLERAARDISDKANSIGIAAQKQAMDTPEFKKQKAEIDQMTNLDKKSIATMALNTKKKAAGDKAYAEARDKALKDLDYASAEKRMKEAQGRYDSLFYRYDRISQEKVAKQRGFDVPVKKNTDTPTKKVTAPKKSSASTTQKSTQKTTGNPATDKRLADLRKAQKEGKLGSMPVGAEFRLKRMERMQKADPTKWTPGQNVAYKLPGQSRYTQTNRGFRIVSVDNETKMARVKMVRDTGLTVTGGNEWISGTTEVHIADLIKESR